jgi:hypothetical protein
MTATNAPVPEAPDAPGGGTAAPAPVPAARSGAKAARPSRLPWRNPWGHPWFLEGFTCT